MSPSTLPWPQWCFYVSCRWGFRTLFSSLGGLQVNGLDHLPFRGPVILAPNHVSLADPWIICAASPNPLRSLAADDLYKVRGLDMFLYGMGAIPLKRGAADPATLSRTRDLLQRGATVMIFPEGGCSPDGQPKPWLPGVALIALRSGVPVVPIVIQGSRKWLPLGTFKPQGGPLRVDFLEPVPSPGLLPGRSVREQVELHRQRLEQAWQRGAEATRSS